MKVAGYNDSVFINCPFDDEYVPILRAIIYTVYRCGFSPTIPGYAILSAQYQEFEAHLPALTRKLGFTVNNIPFIDFLNLVEDAVTEQAK
ncbi:MAG TPA: hypothetical protein VL727_16410 [Puia sp.]|jgi:hypothetical protein|nr:hypothetical protein [Puia sp.]